MKHEYYEKALFEKNQMRLKIKTIQSKHPQFHAYDTNKISLSYFDGKPSILDDGIKTLAYEQKDLK